MKRVILRKLESRHRRCRHGGRRPPDLTRRICGSGCSLHRRLLRGCHASRRRHRHRYRFRASASTATRCSAALREGRSGIEFSERYRERLGLRSCRSTVRSASRSGGADRPQGPCASAGDAAARSNYLAMREAIEDAGLPPGMVSGTSAPGLIVAPAAARRNTRSMLPTCCAPRRAPRRAVHGHAHDEQHDLGVPGNAVSHPRRQLFDQLGLRDQRALHRQCRRTDPVGQAGRDAARRRRRGSAREHDRAVRRHGARLSLEVTTRRRAPARLRRRS